jgi:hypothetical protein
MIELGWYLSTSLFCYYPILEGQKHEVCRGYFVSDLKTDDC